MNNAEFVKLQQEWYAKLKAAGFKDIEYTRSVDGQAFDCALFADARSISPEQYLEGEAYWHRARSYLYEGEFKDDMEKAIWEAYCEGDTYRQICRKVNKSLGKVHSSIHAVKARLLAR